MDFSLRVRESYSVYEIAGMEEQIYSDEWKPRTEVFWIVHGQTRAKKPVVSGYRFDARKLMFSKHGDYINFLAREWWLGMMHTYRLARLTSLTLGVIGYFLLAIPTFDITQAVVIDIFSGFVEALAQV